MFKPGDTVRLVDDTYSIAVTVGKLYTVAAVNVNVDPNLVWIARNDVGLTACYLSSSFAIVHLPCEPLILVNEEECRCSFQGFGHANDCRYLVSIHNK